MEDFDLPSQPREDRPPRVPLKKIQEVNTEATIPIFYKATRHSVTIPLVSKFSREALIVFCDRACRDLYDGAKSFTVIGGDQNAIKDVLQWIVSCVEEQKAVHFMTYPEDTPKLFSKYALAIEVANYLGIPARDFAEGLTKRLMGIARKNLMTWDEVEHFYDDYEDNGLREVAAASVFFGWWRGELDEEKTPDDMCFLSVLRENLPSLDEDLHQMAKKNEEEVRAKWAKKDKEKRMASGGGADFNNSGDIGDGEAPGGGAGGSGWDVPEPQSNVAAGDWNDGGDTNGASGGWDSGATMFGNKWAKENDPPAASAGSSGFETPAPTNSRGSFEDNDTVNIGKKDLWADMDDDGKDDWADEMNDQLARPTVW